VTERLDDGAVLTTSAPAHELGAAALVSPRHGVVAIFSRQTLRSSLLVDDGGRWHVALRGANGIATQIVAAEGRTWVPAVDCVRGSVHLYVSVTRQQFTSASVPLPPACASGGSVSLDVVSRRLVFAVAMVPEAPLCELARSVDGGRTWQLVNQRMDMLGPVVFENAYDGFQAGPGLLVTDDGGRSWHPAPLRLPVGDRTATPLYGPPSLFAGGRAVLPVTLRQHGRQSLAVYVRDRAGGRFRLRSVARVGADAKALQGPLATSIPSPSTMWVAGLRRGRATAWVSSDGGRHFRIVPLPRLAVTYDVTATSASAAWFAGRALYATTDGGRTVRRVRIPG
jgi:hypothetical protein